MSASLVGSEMCIRDRVPREFRGGSAGVRRGFRRGSAGLLRGFRGGSAGGCLLYTSDAADDM
eukprot:9920446-Alexandrium_andersonii.AAC.1